VYVTASSYSGLYYAISPPRGASFAHGFGLRRLPEGLAWSYGRSVRRYFDNKEGSLAGNGVILYEDEAGVLSCDHPIGEETDLRRRRVMCHPDYRLNMRNPLHRRVGPAALADFFLEQSGACAELEVRTEVVHEWMECKLPFEDQFPSRMRIERMSADSVVWTGLVGEISTIHGWARESGIRAYIASIVAGNDLRTAEAPPELGFLA
jgi:hypothetical protein